MSGNPGSQRGPQVGCPLVDILGIDVWVYAQKIHRYKYYIYICICVCIYIYTIYSSPLKFTPRRRGHHFVVIKRGVLEKAYKMIGFQGFFVPTKWWGRVHQPPLFNTPPFCTEAYLARMFDLVFSLNMNFACMLGPCAPKRTPFCKNLFLYHYLSWAWNTFTQNLCYLESRGSISYKMEGFSSCREN